MNEIISPLEEIQVGQGVFSTTAMFLGTPNIWEMTMEQYHILPVLIYYTNMRYLRTDA